MLLSEWVCRDFILPELLNHVFLFAKLIVPYRPLTEKAAADYELRPAPDNPEVWQKVGGRPLTISQQMKEAAKLAKADRGDHAPKKNSPDRGER